MKHMRTVLTITHRYMSKKCTHSRVDFKHKVLFLFWVCDGAEDITHGQGSTAIWSSILYMWGALL